MDDLFQRTDPPVKSHHGSFGNNSFLKAGAESYNFITAQQIRDGEKDMPELASLGQTSEKAQTKTKVRSALDVDELSRDLHIGLNVTGSALDRLPHELKNLQLVSMHMRYGSLVNIVHEKLIGKPLSEVDSETPRVDHRYIKTIAEKLWSEQTIGGCKSLWSHFALLKQSEGYEDDVEDLIYTIRLFGVAGIIVDTDIVGMILADRLRDLKKRLNNDLANIHHIPSPLCLAYNAVIQSMVREWFDVDESKPADYRSWVTNQKLFELWRKLSSVPMCAKGSAYESLKKGALENIVASAVQMVQDVVSHE